MEIKPFRGFTPEPKMADRVVCVPYDVVDRVESAALAEGNPLSLLHVDRAEIDLPGEPNPYADSVYAKAKENFERLQAEGALIREAAPCVYLYRLTMGSHQQTGIVATVRAADYENGLVKKHEKTRPDKEDDRTRLIDTIGAQTGPILLAFRPTPALKRITSQGITSPPDFDITAEDGIRHEVWRLRETHPVVQAFGEVPAVYIADGHHRAASGWRVARARRERGVAGIAHEGILGVLFPSDELQILAYNRLVRTLNGHTKRAFLDAVAQVVSVTPTAPKTPAAPRNVSMYLDGEWYGLSWDVPAGSDPVSSLDVSVLQDRILAPLLGIADPRRSPDIEFVGGIRGTAELESKVDDGRAAVAFSMFPTTVDEVMAIADAGQIMPPKSTWFEPKLRSGFFIHSLED
ncbi:MAG: DUF1015 family protein [Terrimicrobiaceae bacterium]|nr:DUF1015 family protein [Terrimicrobiaceae bacterium]